LPRDVLDEALPGARFYLSALPTLDAAQVGSAKNLEAVIELYGAFPDTIDYQACFDRDIAVLATGPGMKTSVAEMAVAMALSSARGLVQEHELFRRNEEHWLNDNSRTDFTLYGATIGFVGLGSIAREICRLLAPFAPRILAYDPYVDSGVAAELGVTLLPLEDVAAGSRCLFVTAVPTRTNRGLVTRETLARVPDNGLVVLVSRAYVIDFDALVDEVKSNRLRAAIDVWPVEPPAPDHVIRSLPNVTLSPHRAAAVTGGRQLMGHYIVEDIARMIAGEAPSDLQRATPDRVLDLAGVQHSKVLEDMAEERE
jgi:phosphoglycerate dehydrogenase-like enzyme